MTHWTQWGWQADIGHLGKLIIIIFFSKCISMYVMHAFLIFCLCYLFIISVQQLKFDFQTMILVSFFFLTSCKLYEILSIYFKDPNEKHNKNVFKLRNITYLKIWCVNLPLLYFFMDVLELRYFDVSYFIKPNMKTIWIWRISH